MVGNNREQSYGDILVRPGGPSLRTLPHPALPASFSGVYRHGTRQAWAGTRTCGSETGHGNLGVCDSESVAKVPHKH